LVGPFETLRRKSEFSEVYDRGLGYRSPLAVLLCLRSDESGFKHAVVASRKVGGAVRRNRAKRLLREGLRRALGEQDPPRGCRIILIARRATADASGAEVVDAVTDLFKQAGLTSPAQSPEK